MAARQRVGRAQRVLVALGAREVLQRQANRPAQENQIADAAQRIAALVVLLLAGLGHGVIEADVDKAALPTQGQPPKE